MKVPRRLKELHLRLGAATADLSQRLGRVPTAAELAAELGERREEVIEGLIAGSCYRTLSIDCGEGAADAGVVSAAGELDVNLDRIDNQEALRPLLAALSERERSVMLLRFFGSLTQTQIAERLGISQMHVSRLITRSLEQMREQVRQDSARVAS